MFEPAPISAGCRAAPRTLDDAKVVALENTHRVVISNEALFNFGVGLGFSPQKAGIVATPAF